MPSAGPPAQCIRPTDYQPLENQLLPVLHPRAMQTRQPHKLLPAPNPSVVPLDGLDTPRQMDLPPRSRVTASTRPLVPIDLFAAAAVCSDRHRGDSAIHPATGPLVC